MERLKLSVKQAEILASIQTRKAELNNASQILTNQESIVAELAFEAAGIDVSKVSNIKLEGDSLVFELTEEKPKKVKKEKSLEVVK